MRRAGILLLAGCGPVADDADIDHVGRALDVALDESLGAGEVAAWEVSGLQPGDRVELRASDRGFGSDASGDPVLLRPVRLVTAAVADASGEARLGFTVDALSDELLRPGDVVYLQAAHLPEGGGQRLSAPYVEVVPAPGSGWWPLESGPVRASGADQHHATVSCRVDGRCLFVWDAVTDEGAVVRGRVFGPDHRPMGAPVQIAALNSSPGRPDVEPAGSGWVVALNTEWDILLAVVDLDGRLLHGPARANETRGVLPQQGQPDVAWSGAGPVVVWHHVDPDDTPQSRYLIRGFDQGLGPLGDELELAASPLQGSPPDLAASPLGGYVASWVERSDSDNGLYLGWVDERGALADAARVDGGDDTFGGPSRPTVAVSPGGRVAVAWRLQSLEREGLGAFGRLYRPDGRPITDPFALGVDHLDANRATVAWAGSRPVFAWEEPAGRAVYLQAWDVDEARPLGPPWPAGSGGDVTRERPALGVAEVRPGLWDVVVTWEQEAGDDGRDVHRTAVTLAR